MEAHLILSILTPAVPSRFAQVEKLARHIARQNGSNAAEHLILMDNKRRTVGEKRDALLRMAKGDYVAFVDDDDWITDDYVAEICTASERRPDVITFGQGCSVNGVDALCEFGLGNPNEPFQPPRFKRNAWHVCAWRRELAVLSSFPSNSYGEDWAFASKLCAIPSLKSVHIPKVLHYYMHSTETTEAPPPLTVPH